MTARDLRLVMVPRPTRRERLHGAWWPRSTRLDDELAPLLAAVAVRFPVVRGVMLNREEWPESRLEVLPLGAGRTKVSWYGLSESHLAVLHCGDARRISLLLLPPDTPEQIALTATLLASVPGNTLTAGETLSKARAEAGRPV